jgi:hypothetical protein
MNALVPVAPKIGKLIVLLSSDKDGEVLSAARTIGRTLHGAGASWHDLAAAIERPPAVRHAGRPAPASTWLSMAPELRRGFLDWLKDEPWPSPLERDFTASIREQLAVYGGGALSPKQVAVLNRLIRQAAEHRGDRP